MYRAEVASLGGYRFAVKSEGGAFSVDAKGADGVTPPDLLLASLGSCVGVYIRKYADGAKLQLGEFRVTVSGDMGKEPPFYFRDIKVSVELAGAPLDDRRKRALSEFVKNCPVHNTMKNSPAVSVEFF
jgi:uncharacterized OsmC-like protein